MSEECEDGRITGPRTVSDVFGTTCSNQCLHIGTALAQYWCDDHDNDVIQITPTATATAGDTASCQRAVSVCGNGELEADEECEINNLDQVVVHSAPGSLTEFQTDLDPAVSCTDVCLLQRICESDVPAYLSCVEGEDGCANTSDCTLLGASVGYEVSSLCGDGVVGAGESAWCEYSTEEAAIEGGSVIVPGTDPAVRIQNPMQAVTAIGQGTLVDGRMSTEIRTTAIAERVRDSW